MAAEESTAAIVLRARDYAESDRIVTLLTLCFGKLSGIAKGAKASRRRFERKLEPFSCVTLFFRRRPFGQLVFITRAEAGPTAHPLVENDLGKIALGSYMLELADALTSEEAEATGAYQVLTEALATLSAGPASVALRHAYELKLLRVTGYGLEFARCRRCGNAIASETAALYFVVSRGGIVCSRCRPEAPEGAVRLDAASAMALARLDQAPLQEVPALPSGNEAAGLALDRFLGSILDRRLRSAEFLDSLV
jgi:DNA repair protein RecO (recombination protein O)